MNTAHPLSAQLVVGVQSCAALTTSGVWFDEMLAAGLRVTSLVSLPIVSFPPPTAFWLPLLLARL